MLTFSILDFDPRHDGAVIAPAVALHLGYTMFNDAFGLYGPVSPLIQSIALNFPPGSVLSLRYSNAAFIAVTIFFMADLGRIAPIQWKITQRATVMASLTWLFLCDVYFGITMHPWSSVIAGLFAMGGLYFIAVSQKKFIQKKKFSTLFYGVVSGLLFGLLPFVKINIGLASILGLVAVFLISTLDKQKLIFSTYTSVLLGILLSTSIVVSHLLASNTLGKFLEQSILFPLSQSSIQIEGWRTKENLTRMFFEQILFTLLSLLVPIFLQSKNRISNNRFLLMATSFAAGAVIVLGEFALSLKHFQIKEPATEFRIQNIFLYLNANFLAFFMVSSVVCFLVVSIWSLIRIFKSRLSPHDSNSFPSSIFYVLMCGIGLGLILQIVPTWDTRHIWWGLPVGLILFFSIMEKVSLAKNASFVLLVAPLVAVVLLAAFAGFENLRKPREKMTEIAFANGMQLPVAQKLVLRDDAQFLSDNLGLENKAVFLVWHGYLSVINGSYQSADLYYTVPEVNNGPSISDRVSSGEPIVVEDAIYSDALNAEILDLGYDQCAITANFHLRIYKKNC